ncbi:PEP-CTERM sorting domain-containing protein [Rugamonas sp.]|uniref:PEP-CTERM sorting domain-containing protein n=1 Tax=Rugamonas sp. TaxID=1926287 RepID=UPI0025CBD037|nr:PEP-CTERM sorting domain-containing protein [Rugamonas sp.]
MHVKTLLSAALLALSAGAGAAAHAAAVVIDRGAVPGGAVAGDHAYCHAGAALCGTPARQSHRPAAGHVNLSTNISINASQPGVADDTEDHLLAAQADRAKNSAAHADIATPVPEPKAYMMLLVGLALLGVSISRREATDKFSA